MAWWFRVEHLLGLRRHQDAGNQFTPIHNGEHFEDMSAVPLTGSIDNSIDLALAKTENVTYKAELVWEAGNLEPE